MRTQDRPLTRLMVLAALIASIVASGTIAPSSNPLVASAEAAAHAGGYPYPNAPDCDEYGSRGCVVDKWNFYQGQCTSGVAYQLSAVNGLAFSNSWRGVRWGNAGTWADKARALGITVNSRPAVGAVAEWSYHVGWISEVYGDGSFLLWEMNYDWHNGVRTRRIYPGTSAWPRAIIHFKDLPAPSSQHGYVGEIVRAPEGDAYLVKADGRRYWIPTGGDYAALTANGLKVRQLGRAQVDRIPNSGQRATVHTIDDPNIYDPGGYVSRRVDGHGHAGDRYTTWTTTPGGKMYNRFTWTLAQAPGKHRIKVFVPHREANATTRYRVYDGDRLVAHPQIRQVDIYGWTTIHTGTFRSGRIVIVLDDNEATARNQTLGIDAAQVVPIG